MRWMTWQAVLVGPYHGGALAKGGLPRGDGRGPPLDRAKQILPATSSTRMTNPRFLSQTTSFDVASD